MKNNPKVTVSFSPRSFYEGGKTVATIKSPAKKGLYMTYLIDGKEYLKNIDLSKGKAYKGFYKLKAGTHKIRLSIYDKKNKVYYSKAFKITVKPKIVISSKNIAFKKSYSKFTVKATLKIKGKLAKYKIPTYFFIYEKLPSLANGKVDAVSLKKEIIDRMSNVG